ncbi:hypothetical protein DM785_02730 [Deinococcus actinosclerus]|nr:hypothetical protein DM785_02730 [Deinococcus actinosclerus]
MLSYTFLREGQGWPTRAGLLAWVDGAGALTRVSVRVRRAGDAAPSTQPVTFEVWPALPARPDPRDVTLTHAGTLTPPDAATLNGAPTPLLTRWQEGAPGEPGGERPHLPTVTGPDADLGRPDRHGPRPTRVRHAPDHPRRRR